MSFADYFNDYSNYYDSIIFSVKYICSFKWQQIKSVICRDVWIMKLFYSCVHNEQWDNNNALCSFTFLQGIEKKQRMWPG